MNLIKKSLSKKIEKLNEENERLKDEIEMLYSKLENKQRVIELNNVNMDCLADTNKELKKEIERLETINKYADKTITRLLNYKEDKNE